MLLADLLLSSSNRIISAALTYSVGSTTNQTSYTYNGIPIGSAPAGGNRRYIVVVVASNDADSGNHFDNNSLTIDGNTMTPVIYRNALESSAMASAGIYYIEWPTGTTANFVVDIVGTSNAVRGMGFNVHSIITGHKGLQVEDSDSVAGYTNTTINLQLTQGSYIVGAVGALNGGAYTFNRGTVHTSTDLEGNDWVALMSDSVSVATNPYTIIVNDGGDPGVPQAFAVAAFSAKQV